MADATASPLAQFLAIIKGVAKRSKHPIPPHITPLTEGHALPEPEDLEAGIGAAGQDLEDAQCACLFANIVNLCITDGRIADRGLVAFSRDYLRLSERDARDVEEAVETRYKLAEEFRNDREWAIFCAGLFAMAAADDELVESEKKYLQRFSTDLKHIEAGQKLFDEKGNGIAEKLATLNNRQKKIYAAHAIAIMFIDGQWKGTEQEFMDMVAKRMLIVQFDLQRLLKGLYTLFNVRVFA